MREPLADRIGRWAGTCLVVLLVLFGGLAPAIAADRETELARFEGVWVADTVTSAGRKVPANKFPFEIHFEGNRMIYRFVGDVKGKDRVHTIVLGAESAPATIDITRDVGGVARTVYGIYKFEGERLLLCTSRGKDGQPGSERPKEFESDSSSRADLLDLKRKSD